MQSNTTISVREPLRERPAEAQSGTGSLVSVVVPTKNERGNVARLVERLGAVLPTVAMEIVFVDASTDGTAEAIERMATLGEREIVCCGSRPTAASAASAEPCSRAFARRVLRGSASWTPTSSIRPS